MYSWHLRWRIETRLKTPTMENRNPIENTIMMLIVRTTICTVLNQNFVGSMIICSIHGGWEGQNQSINQSIN